MTINYPSVLLCNILPPAFLDLTQEDFNKIFYFVQKQNIGTVLLMDEGSKISVYVSVNMTGNKTPIVSFKLSNVGESDYTILSLNDEKNLNSPLLLSISHLLKGFDLPLSLEDSVIDSLLNMICKAGAFFVLKNQAVKSLENKLNTNYYKGNWA